MKGLLSLLLLAACLPCAAAAPARSAPVADVRADGDAIDTLIEKGRALLDDGRPAEAQKVFEQAAAADHDSFRTRTWVLRSWMDQGRINDCFDELDALKKAGQEGPTMDYLFGMAFVRNAERLITQGTSGTTIGPNMQDGYRLLSSALPTDPRGFRDGWLALARAAWYQPDLKTARDAIEKAVGFFPTHPDVHLMKGRIALSQFAAAKPADAKGPDEWGDEATRDWDAAVKSFGAALERAEPTPENTTRQMLVSQAGVQLANTLMWKSDRAGAARAYARAIGWAPWGVDFSSLYDQLYDGTAKEPYAFVLQSLEDGEKAYEQHFGKDTQADATTLWWLGWTRLQVGDDDGAETAYESVLAKWPAYTDSWYRLALARYNQKDWAGATDALVSGWKADGPTMVSVMEEGDQKLNLARVDYLKGWAVKARRLADAAVLAELNAETAQTDAVQWNDLGLFLRDRGDQIRNEEKDPDEAAIAALDERSLTAYERALALEPDNPQLLNDTAVVLHYYLHRDLDRARDMYTRAKDLASKALAGSPPPSQVAVLKTALRDATNNLAKLEAASKDGADPTPGG